MNAATASEGGGGWSGSSGQAQLAPHSLAANVSYKSHAGIG